MERVLIEDRAVYGSYLAYAGALINSGAQWELSNVEVRAETRPPGSARAYNLWPVAAPCAPATRPSRVFVMLSGGKGQRHCYRMHRASTPPFAWHSSWQRVCAERAEE